MVCFTCTGPVRRVGEAVDGEGMTRLSGRLRILLIVHQYPPARLGGVEVYTRQLAHALTAQGHQVLVLAGDARDGCSEEEGVRVERVSSPLASRGSPLRVWWSGLANRRVEGRFAAVCREFQPDILHIQHLLGLSARLIGIARRERTATVVTLHDYWAVCSNAHLLFAGRRPCSGPVLGVNCAVCAAAGAGLPGPAGLYAGAAPLFALRNALLRRALARADLLLAPSHFLHRLLTRLGLPAAKTRYTELGIDLAPFSPRGGEPEGGVTFGFLGSLARQKGVHLLVEAFNRLPASARLLLYGDPTPFPDYVAHLEGLVRRPGVAFMGRVPHREVGRALQGMDVLVVPSIWYENSPLVIRESFAAGVPVLVARIGALEEQIRPGKDGLFFEAGSVESLAERMDWLCQDPRRIAALRESIRRPREIEAHVRELEGFYNTLLEENP